MNLKLLFVTIGVVLAAILGISFGREKNLQSAIEAKRKAERTARDAKLDTVAERHRSHRKVLETSLQIERARPVAARIGDSYRRAKAGQGAVPKE